MSKDTESQHSEASPQPTPGPWTRCEAQPDAIVGPRCKPGTCNICDYKLGSLGIVYESNADWYGGHFVCESVSSTANANLIIASADLLTALEDCVTWLDALDAANEATQVIRSARLAMRKAKVGQP